MQHAQCCFNGATPFQTWKCSAKKMGTGMNVQLQWGHAFSDVEMSFGDFCVHWEDRLQWGHAFSDVEIAGVAAGPVVR